MRITGKHSPAPTKPSPNPTALPNEPDRLANDQDHGEGSYRATRDYQKSLKSYLATADVEKDARAAAPDDAKEARDMQKAEDTGRKHAKTQGNAKGK